MSRMFSVHLALTIAGIVYGANYVIAKTIMPDYIPPFGLIVVRVFFATILFWGFHALVVKEKVVRIKDYGKFFFVSIFGVGVNMLAFFKGLNYTSPVNASIIMTLVPIIVLVASYFILKEPITKRKLIGISLGAFGTLLLLTFKGVALTNTRFIGDLLILVNGIFYGIYLVIVKPLMMKYHPVTVIKWIFTFGFILVLPFGSYEAFQINWSEMPVNIWLSVIYVIAGTTFSTYLLNAWALKHVSPSVAGAYIYLQPVFATFVAVVFAGENLPIYKIGFSILIFAGVYLVSTNPKIKIKSERSASQGY